MKNVLGDLQALRGADLVLFSSEGYFPSLMTARAADNGIWLVAASGDPANVWDSAGHQGGEPAPYGTTTLSEYLEVQPANCYFSIETPSTDTTPWI